MQRIIQVWRAHSIARSNRLRRKHSLNQGLTARMSGPLRLTETLELRTLLTDLIGIDFGPTGDLSPTNWNSATGNGGNNFSISDLVDESGATTPVDLVVTFDEGLDALLASPGPDASVIPGHTNSLTNIDGVLVSDSSITFTFSDLVPQKSYEIFVFGGDHLTTYSQQVTIIGQATLPAFTQAWNEQFWVNSHVANSNIQLDDQAIVAIADGSGEIQIHVQETTELDFAVIPALAIRSVTGSDPPPATGSLIGLDFDSVTGAAPTHWTHITQDESPWQITNLIDETGVATSVDLTIDSGSAGPLGSFVTASIPTDQIPTHSNSLAEIAGTYVFDEAVMLTFSDLSPNSDYEVYVFGGFPAGGPSSQDVTIQGDGAPVSFRQSWTNSLLLNDRAGSNAGLDTFATTVTPTSGGRISILVQRSQLDHFVALSGVAIRPVDAVRSGQLSVSIADTAVSEYDFASASTVTITRSSATTESLDVALTSSDSSELSVVSMVTIPAGQQAATVPLDAVFDGVADGNQLVSITATASGHNVASDNVFVIDADYPSLTVLLSATLQTSVREILESEGSNAYELQVLRNTEDISQPLTVNLVSTDTSEITLPAQVTIPANSVGVNFMVDAIDDSIADGTQVVRIYASHPGFTSPHFRLYIDDDDEPSLNLAFAASTVAENDGAAATTATITRNTPTDEALTVALVSGAPSELSVPATITIPAGQSAVTFDVDAVDETESDGSKKVTVSATEVTTGIDVQQDLTFGAAGRIRADVRNDVSPGHPDVAIQSDGKLVVIGRNVEVSNAWNVLRYNSDGTPDATFGTAGKVTSTHSSVSSVATERLRLLPDGRIVVMGTVGSNSVIIRYNADGSLDTTLNGDGILTIIPEGRRAVDFTVDASGAMYVVANSTNAEISVRKFSAIGAEVYAAKATLPDIGSQTPFGITLQPDGKLLVFGSANPVSGNDQLTVIRFDTDGSLDTDFAVNGIQTFDAGRNHTGASFQAAVTQSDGKIIVVGSIFDAASSSAVDRQWVVARYTTAGELDSTFSGDGFEISSFESNIANEARTVSVQSDGKIVVTGLADFSTVTQEIRDRVIVRYNADGTRDALFGEGGVQLLSPNAESFEAPVAAALQTDGNLVMLSIDRYNARVDRYELNPGPLTTSADIDVTDNDVSADLKGVSFNVTNDHVATGVANVTFTVQNVGVSATPAFQTQIVWSPNAILGDADDQIVAGSVQSFGSLAASGTASRNFNLTLDRAVLYQHAVSRNPAGGAVGTSSADFSHLFLVLDINDSVVENSEANNSGVATGDDSDRIAYFPWDKNRNGTVEPLEALTTIQAIGTSDSASDFDGNGIVSPFEALSASERIGYTLDATVQTTAASVPLRQQAVTFVSQPVAAFVAPRLAKPLAAATAVAPGPQSLKSLSSIHRPPIESQVSWATDLDEERDSVFPQKDAEADRPSPPIEDDQIWRDESFSNVTDWLSVI